MLTFAPETKKCTLQPVYIPVFHVPLLYMLPDMQHV